MNLQRRTHQTGSTKTDLRAAAGKGEPGHSNVQATLPGLGNWDGVATGRSLREGTGQFSRRWPSNSM